MRLARILRLDLPALVIAAVLAIAAGCPLITTGSTSRTFYFFDVTLTSDTEGTTQFFWDLGEGINEGDSSVQTLRVEPRPVVYRFMVPTGTFKGFRFDPVDRPARLTLAHARLVDARGRLARAFGPEDFRAASPGLFLTRDGDTLRCEVTADAVDPALDLVSGAPVGLPLRSWMRFRLALPVSGAAFLIGLFLCSPEVIARWRRLAARPTRWLATHPRATILLVVTVGVGVQAHPVIFFGRSFVSPNNGSMMLYGRHPTLPGAKQAVFADTMGSDVGAMLFQHLYYPMVQHEALFKHGELPFWNRYSLTGDPLWGQGQSLVGDPFNLLTILANGASWAWDIRFLLARWLLAAGLGLTTWMLTRHLPSSILVAGGGIFLGFFTFRINHAANFSVGYAPWILLAWVGLGQTRRTHGELGWLVGLLVANWIEFSSGTLKEAVVLMGCLNLAGVGLIALAPFTEGRRLRLLALGTGAGAIFLLLAAPLWLTFLTTLRHSVTAYDIPTAQTYSLGKAIGLFDDIFYRQNGADEPVVGPSLNILFLLGVLSWLVTPSAWHRDRCTLALLLAALVSAAFAFGIVPAALIVKIPFVGNIVHIGNTFSCPLIILLALVAGSGFNEIAGWPIRSGRWWFQLGLAALLAAVPTLAFFYSGPAVAKSLFFEGYALALGLAAAALPLGFWWSAQTRRANAWVVALVLGLPLLLWRHSQYLHTPFNRYAFSPGERVDIRAPSAAVAFVNSMIGHEPVRVIGLQNNLFPNYNTVLGWEHLYGADALRSGYYLELTGKLRLGRVWDWASGTPDDHVGPLKRGHDFLNVGYYVSDHREPASTFPGLKLEAQHDLDVYSSPARWPRAFFTDQVAEYNQAEGFVRQLARGDGRPFASVQAGEQATRRFGNSLADRTIVAAQNYRLTTNTTSFTILAPGPGVVVLTEPYYDKDFEATIDGAPVAYFRVNHAFKGVVLASAGHHEIVFRYRPSSFTVSLWLGGAGILALAMASGTLYFPARKKASFAGADVA